MEEKIYNLFYYVKNHKLLSLGVQEHIVSGTDDEKIEYLKSKINSDYQKCYKTKVASKILVNANSHSRVDGDCKLINASDIDLSYFDRLLEQIGAPRDVLHVITPIVDGKPTVEVATYYHYIREYTRESKLDFNGLINDDYFDAITILYNNKKYVSCTKLLVSFIDTISYLEYGDEKGSFIKWLSSFADIDGLGITPEQLWEYRNSILHMTNLDSRKTLVGKENRIRFVVAKSGIRQLPEGVSDDGCILFNLLDLIVALARGIERWVESMNANPEKYEIFFKRYDRILSDRRVTYYYG